MVILRFGRRTRKSSSRSMTLPTFWYRVFPTTTFMFRRHRPRMPRNGKIRRLDERGLRTRPRLVKKREQRPKPTQKGKWREKRKLRRKSERNRTAKCSQNFTDSQSVELQKPSIELQ